MVAINLHSSRRPRLDSVGPDRKYKDETPHPRSCEARMRALPLSLCFVALSCARTTSTADTHLPPGGLLITQDQVEKSGGHTAWEVLKRTAPMLTVRESRSGRPSSLGRRGQSSITFDDTPLIILDGVRESDFRVLDRSEEHTSELQSLAYLVCRLLLEKKKK